MSAGVAHEPWLVLLSLAVAIQGAYVGLSLAVQVRESVGLRRRAKPARNGRAWPAPEQSAFGEVDRRIEGYALPVSEEGQRFVVISTQGRGDEAALRAALASDSDYIAFVGSRKKAAALTAALAADGIDAARLAAVKAPAGLDLGAITPEEIALSILAEIIATRRMSRRKGAARLPQV